MINLTYKLLQEDVKEGSFDCGVASINEYVVNSFYATLLQHGYAYQITSKNKVLGYYMITFNHIRIDECPEYISEYTSNLNDYLYSVEIKYLAIEQKYQKHKVGTSILPTIIQSIKDYAKTFPIRFITIDARNDLLSWYKKFGFREFPKNPKWQDGYTTKMFIDCMIRPEALQQYVSQYI